MGRAVATPRQLRQQRDVLTLKYFSRISGKLNQIHLNVKRENFNFASLELAPKVLEVIL